MTSAGPWPTVVPIIKMDPDTGTVYVGGEQPPAMLVNGRAGQILLATSLTTHLEPYFVECLVVG